MRGLREIGYSRDYRPDVDGLRAIAVSCVLFFHAEVPGFGGGFVGVDLFFVISGFLITRNIYLDHRDGRWSFTEFYLRRARRLLPALLVTLFFTFAAGVVFLAPEHLERLGHSLIRPSSAPTFCSGRKQAISTPPPTSNRFFTPGPWPSKSSTTCSGRLSWSSVSPSDAGRRSWAGSPFSRCR